MNLEQYNDFFLSLPIEANGGRCYEPDKFKNIGVSKIEKPNKTLEYGDDEIEVHIDAFTSGQKVLIIDDVLATGGTLKATNKLADVAGYNIVGNLVAVDLKFVPRTEEFDLNVKSVIEYE